MIRKKIEDIKIKKKLSFKSLENNKINFKEIINKRKAVHRKISRSPQLINKKRNSNKFILFLFIFTLLFGSIFWSSILFENVNIIITQKSQKLSLDHMSLTASKGLQAQIPFEVMIVTDNKSENIFLSKKENISLKAKGEITLYNKNSKNTEKLPIHTYISDDNGKVYLTDKTVHIPGFIKKENKIIPGKVIVSVTSFLPGEAYNGNPTNFYINSFKGTDKYKKIYGKADTTLSGGAQGQYYTLSDTDKTNLNNLINSNVKNKFIKKVSSLIPEDYLFYPKASNFSYKIANVILSKTPNTNIIISGTLSAIIFKREGLNKSILDNLLPTSSSKELERIKISGLDKLIFNFINNNQTINKNLKSISFDLTGPIDLIWNPDIMKIKEKLLGVSKEKISSVFKNSIGVENASVKIFPPWQKILPLSSSKIKISTN